MKWSSRSNVNVLTTLIVLAFLALTMLSVFLWVASLRYGSVGIFSLGADTSVRFERGTAEVRHVYKHDFAPPVPADQWHDTAVSRGWVMPPRGRMPPVPTFAFSSGLVIGRGGYAGSVFPARCWLLHVPLWAAMLPGMLTGTWMYVRWTRARQERRRGFDIVAGSSPAPTPRC